MSRGKVYISVGNQLPILLISFPTVRARLGRRWESVTNPLDKLSNAALQLINAVGNQLPILLISFVWEKATVSRGWESVTNPLDKLCLQTIIQDAMLGISYQSS